MAAGLDPLGCYPDEIDVDVDVDLAHIPEKFVIKVHPGLSNGASKI